MPRAPTITTSPSIPAKAWALQPRPLAPPASTNLAILYPTRAALADAFRRLVEAGIALDGAADHGVSQALYLRDPDNNGVELYWDRPPETWPRTRDGKLSMFTRPLDLQNLLAESPTQNTPDLSSPPIPRDL